MQHIKNVIAQQYRDVEELSSELQRKEITPDRIIRLVKIVRRNLDLMDRMATMLEAMGAPELPDADLPQRLMKLAEAQEQLKRQR